MKNKINIIRAILIIMLLFIFFKIFDFSNQDGEKSSSISREITETVTKNIKSIQKLEKNEKEKVLLNFEHIIRKIAHFLLYMLVGLLLISLLSTYNLKQKNRFLISFLVSLLYAISDEIHQSFIPGRSSLFSDVIIDSCGAIFGIIVTYNLIIFIKSIYIKKLGTEKNEINK